MYKQMKYSPKKHLFKRKYLQKYREKNRNKFCMIFDANERVFDSMSVVCRSLQYVSFLEYSRY